MPSCFVTGATGVIGSALVRVLCNEGWQVTALARQAVPPGLLPASVRCVQGDLSDSAALLKGSHDAEVVFHLAAMLHINNPSFALKDVYRQVNVEGTRRVVQAAQQTGVKRLLFFSTINVYAPGSSDQMIDESSPVGPTTLYGQTKAEAEQIVSHANSGLETVILRLSAVYGPQMKGNYPRLLRALRKGVYVRVGSGRNRRTLIYIDDVVRGAILVAQHPAAVGQLFNLTDGHVHRLDEIIAAMSRAINRRPLSIPLPLLPLRAAVGVAEAGFGLVGRRPPITRGMINTLTEDVAVSGTQMQRILGFQPQYSLEQGWQATAQAFLKEG